MNKVEVSGNLTRDPEFKTGQSGNCVCKFSVASSKRVTVNGEAKELTEFVNVVVFDPLAGTCAKNLHKGTGVIVLGEYKTRSYEKNGEKRYMTNVVASEVGIKLYPEKRDPSAFNQFGMAFNEPREYEEVPF